MSNQLLEDIIKKVMEVDESIYGTPDIVRDQLLEALTPLLTPTGEVGELLGHVSELPIPEPLKSVHKSNCDQFSAQILALQRDRERLEWWIKHCTDVCLWKAAINDKWAIDCPWLPFSESKPVFCDTPRQAIDKAMEAGKRSKFPMGTYTENIPDGSKQ